MKKIITILALIILVMISGCIQESEDLSVTEQEEIDEICIDKCGDSICQDAIYKGGVYMEGQKPPCQESVESCPQDCRKEQTCSDGTLKDNCSSEKPKYCKQVQCFKAPCPPLLIDNCQTCGCPAEQECQSDGSCEQKQLYDVIETGDVRGSVGKVVEFSITIKETPRDIETFGLSVFFDSDVLEYRNYEKGLIVEGFQFFEVNEEFNGQLNVGGFTTQGIIKKGSRGQLVKLSFKVLKCEESVIEVKNLVDNMDDWFEVEGDFRCEI